MSDWGPSRGALALALAGTAALAAWLVSGGDTAPRTLAAAAPTHLALPAAAPPAVAVVAAAASGTATPARPEHPSARPTPRIPRLRDANGDQTPDLADFINEGETPTMAEVITRLHQAGVHTGLGAFNPPGTRPPLIGLAVPESFELPPGYVRHHQATDDGQRIEAVLMFAPDARLLDASGRPIPIPANRVVPPEHAPAGLPLRQITLPTPRS